LTFDAHPRSSLIVALDFDSLSTALRFASQISDLVGMFKIGSQLFTTAGPEAVRQVAKLGADIFLDLKFHDIPNTVAGAVLAAAALPRLQLVNVHALGGTAMMHAAVQAVSAGVPMGADRPRLLAVTLLTSMDAKTVREVGIGGPPNSRVVKLAKLAQKAGVDGVVASVQEAKAIRKACGRDFLIVTPGVRPKGKDTDSQKDDQARTATPREAIRAGADFIVVGRPILAAADPRAAAQEIVDEIASAKS
jgi:orotidine-5'-phosphate decarboxylase